MSANAVERLREICLALPEVSERASHGEPAWFVVDAYRLVAPNRLVALLDSQLATNTQNVWPSGSAKT